MSDIWLLVLLTGVSAMALKAAGPVLLGGRELPAGATSVVALLAPSLLAALIATATFAGDRRLEIDERALGLAAAALALAFRAPVLAVVVIAATVTALARALG